ncbi:uncharacterized protein B0T23DRAFT_397879 [Neurospora hispaniola]|uniref:Uncharacterized protein n=1 Tax=Neurospora hispaniola TaxID=588809 RepID=A0AAJ0I4C2_9PEZI|nr:hypothetical protein B0T23DRAFT_397879 [Neurospora hispaniola]
MTWTRHMASVKLAVLAGLARNGKWSEKCESHESSPRRRGSDRSRDYLDETSCFDVRESFRTLQKKRRKKGQILDEKSREDQGWYLNTLRRDEQGTGLTGTVHAQLEAAAICKQDAYQDGKL